MPINKEMNLSKELKDLKIFSPLDHFNPKWVNLWQQTGRELGSYQKLIIIIIIILLSNYFVIIRRGGREGKRDYE
jgi:hypothetical protein